MAFCFTLPLCFPNLLYDTVLLEIAVGVLAVGVPSSSSWFVCSGHPVLPVLLCLSMDALARRGTNLMCDFIILLISSMDVSFLLNLGCSGNYMHRACSVCNGCLVSMTLLNLFPKNNNKKSS